MCVMNSDKFNVCGLKYCLYFRILANIVLCFFYIYIFDNVYDTTYAQQSQQLIYLPMIQNMSNSMIAFITNRDGNVEIYRMNADGSNEVRLTDTSTDEGAFDWSPDGAKIVFVSQRDGNSEIYVMNADGSNQTRLTTTSALEDRPQWSPNGTNILFFSERDGENALYSMNMDGSYQIRLTTLPVPISRPRYSPDGTQIVFVAGDYDTTELYTMKADGSAQKRLTNSVSDKAWPTWSPDGTKIAFCVYSFSNQSTRGELNVINSDGSNLQRIYTATGVIFDSLSWSPDGSKLLFISSYNNANRDVSLIDINTVEKKDLTNTPEFEFYPTWSPDGSLITFSSLRNSAEEIYSMNIDGFNQTRLTNSGMGGSAFPIWSP